MRVMLQLKNGARLTGERRALATLLRKGARAKELNEEIKARLAFQDFTKRLTRPRQGAA
jgi:hypothetical protein